MYYRSFDGDIPFVLYCDDFEGGNPVGSHKGVHKIGAIYSSLRCMEPYMYCSLRNTYLVSLFHSSTRERLGNKRVLAPLLSELVNLEKNGVVIGKKFYKLTLACILGDILCIHSMSGMVGCFPANHYCRF